MSLLIRDFDLRVVNLKTRLPFRYGIVTVTALPHLFISADCEIDGQPVRGVAAEHLAAKWFTKNPAQHYRDEIAEMTHVIRAACRHAVQAGQAATPFELWRRVYLGQKRWAAATTYPPLLAGLGVSLVERAMLDAFCRGRGISFSQALRRSQLGLDLRQYFTELLGRPDLLPASPAADLLPAQPLDSVTARHTVGLIDPLTDADIAPADRLDDGLPQSLEECIRVYGLCHFKIKLAGDVPKDLARLRQLAGILDAACGGDYAFTLDGNENFKELAPFRSLWQELVNDPALRGFIERLIFIEQPLHRDVALSPAIKAGMLAWKDRPPLIIDESDGTLAGLATALDCGYIGTSHKNCKGIFKSIANACLIESLRRFDPARKLMLSGEDLSNVGPIALQQDLAVAANLGIASIERNGQHYFRGLSMHSQALQQQVQSAHPDLFEWNVPSSGSPQHGNSPRSSPGNSPAQPFATVAIRAGRISTKSVCAAPFGVGFDLDTSPFQSLDTWKFESLGIA